MTDHPSPLTTREPQVLPSIREGHSHLLTRGRERPLSSLSDEAIWEGLARALRVFAREERERLRHG